ATITAGMIARPRVTALYGESGTAKLLVLSQVVLSLQLPFAVVPLVRFTSDRAIMGGFANSGWLRAAAILITLTVIGLNSVLLFQVFGG
ncbi:divalent metal cation transporter, partial [Escherichia coli]|uniref:divalent metal cation transporter n=1 Tax=Escherichia coli TaxID=562 RepID=UPI0019319545